MRRLRIRRLEAETARRLDRSQQQLQHMQRTAGLEAVGMRGNPAHRMHRDRAADHLVMLFAFPVGPWLVDDHLAGEGGLGKVSGKLADARGTDADLRSHRFRRIIIGEIGVGHQHEGRNSHAAALHLDLALQRRLHRRIAVRRRLAGGAVDHLRRAVIITKEQPVIGRARIADHQPGGVGVAHKIVDIDLAGLHQLAHQRQDEQPVRARGHAIPVVGNRGIAGLHRVHRDHPRAACLQLAETHLDRVRIMILGNAEQHKQLGQVPVGRAEFPEGTAKSVDAAGRHIDRTEAAMCGEIRGAELLRPPAGQRL